ncbi:hypothetical protein ACWCQS_13735 [Streptomyces sp. NPDC002076]
MGFGYKTSWLAVTGATVTGPVDGWALAHGRSDLTPGLAPTGTNRVGDCHAYPSASANPPQSSGSPGSGLVGSRTQPRC